MSKRIWFDIREVAEMNLTASAMAGRLKISTTKLNAECKRVYGMNWAELKKIQRNKKNEELSGRVVGRLSYFGTVKTLGRISHSQT